MKNQILGRALKFVALIGAFIALLSFSVVFAIGCEVDFDIDCEPEQSFNSISGYKWYDYNGDGEWYKYGDDGLTEPALQGWTIWLVNYDTGLRVDETYTDSNGYYAFEGVANGNYKICEEDYNDSDNSGWSQTYPKEVNGDTVLFCDSGGQAPLGHYVRVSSRESGNYEYSGFDFGNTYALGTIRISKFNDLDNNGSRNEESEPLLPGWEICISNDGIDDGFLSSLESFFFEDFDGCSITDDSGNVSWTGLPAGFYEAEENMNEEQQEQGWIQTAAPEDENEGEGRIHLEAGEEETAAFGNHRPILDDEEPESFFDDLLAYRVFDSEPGLVNTSGGSSDASGVSRVDMSLYRVGGTEATMNFPGESFFDIFTEIDCRDIIRGHNEPLTGGDIIPIEIVSLSLTSVEPITVPPSVSWMQNWTLQDFGSGIYCFDVKATDNVGNAEDTAFAGPVAYIPTAHIAEETEIISPASSASSLTIEWITDHPATSRVVYDTVSHEILGDAPNYGYAFSTLEQDLDPKVLSHHVIISGLDSATAYFYRVISRGSPEMVGEQQSARTNSASGGIFSGGGGISPIQPVISPIVVQPEAEVLGVSISLEEVLSAKIIVIQKQLIGLLEAFVNLLQSQFK